MRSSPATFDDRILSAMKKYLVKPGSKVVLAKSKTIDYGSTAPSKEERLQQLAVLSERLDKLQEVFYASGKHKLLIVLQGMDTSGKDGTIRQVFHSVDPLGIRVAYFKTPTEEEKSHDYLWRVHRQVPGNGEIVIFNRSHYEDVLITLVHGWIDAKECKRRYEQINAFEQLLCENGTVILKFYLHMSKDEQKRRLEERLADPDKQWKFRLGDLQERKLWNDYMRAYESAITATSSKCAPWHVVPADSKSSRNVFISSVLVETLEGLKLRYPRSQENLKGVVVD
jgi:PPK2 family polyphosphate:nucleotide phosphotransferase